MREWCEDWFDVSQNDRVIRGAAWRFGGHDTLRSSKRGHFEPTHRDGGNGFRCVLAGTASQQICVVSPLAASGSLQQPPAMPAAATEATLENILGAVGECLDRASAEALLCLRADARLQARIEELADRCTVS